MDSKRIIAALDIKDDRVVTGVKFVDLRDAGDPVEAAVAYEAAGIDELVFLDINATHENRGIRAALAAEIAARVTIPFTVGGGIRDLDDMEALFDAGVGKVFINSAALADPTLISCAAEKFGGRRLVLAIDAKSENGVWAVYTRGGRVKTGREAVEWAVEAARLGAGEILLTCIDADGTQNGYDIAMTRAVSEAAGVPVTASGGAGCIEHFYEALTEGKAAAALAASLFHDKLVEVKTLKEALKSRGIDVIL